MDFSAVEAGYANLWHNAKVRPEHEKELHHIVSGINLHKDSYVRVEQATGVPWWVVACLDQMEGGGGAHTHLHNGDSLARRTVHVPAGRPPGNPPFTFLTSAIDALHYDGLTKIKEWSIPRFLFEAERYNGLGYYKHRVNSPYLWSYTTEYGSGVNVGKFVSDGRWDSSAISGQPGVAAILKTLNPMPDKPVPPVVNPVNINDFWKQLDNLLRSSKSMSWSSLFSNWKTTSAGFAALVAAFSHLVYQYQTKSFDVHQIFADVSAIMAGFGLVAASDAKSSS